MAIEFNDRSEELQGQRMDDATGNRNELITAHTRRNTDRGKQVETHLSGIYLNQANAIRAEIQAIRERQEGELSRHQANYLLKRQSESLRTLTRLHNEVIRMDGGEDKLVNTEDQASILGARGRHLLFELSAKQIVEMNDPANPEAIGKAVPMNVVELAKKLNEKGSPTEKEWNEIIIPRMKKEMEKPSNRFNKSIAVILLSYLEEGDRMELLKRVADHPKASEFALEAYRSDYLQKTQITEAFKDMPDKKATLLALKSPNIDKERARRLAQLEPLGRYFGHKNRAKEILSLQGIGTLVALTHAGLTALFGLGHGNLAAITAGAVSAGAQAGIALELSKGIGGILPTPSEGASRLSREKKIERKEAQDQAQLSMQKEVANNEAMAAFYYAHSDDIAGAYESKIGTGVASKGLTLKDIKVTPEQLAEEYPGLTPAQVEKTVSQWARRFYGMGEGVSRKTGGSQRNLIDAAFKRFRKKTMKEILGSKNIS